MSEGSVQSLAHRMGLSAPATHRKAEELVRLLGVRGGSRLTLSASARAVICLEVAASLTNTSVDKKLAIQLSGLKRPQYVALSQTVIRLLDVSPKATVSDLCILHSATPATQLAQRVLARYEEEGCGGEVDLSLPAYPTAAILAACKVLKVKVDKQRLFESSGCKKKMHLRLVEAMTPLAQKLHKAERISGNKRGRTLMELVEENLRRQDSPEKRSKIDGGGGKDEAGEVEAASEGDFEAWKKKILEAAAAAK